MYNEDNQIRLKTSMLSSSLCDYSDSYILVKGTITVENKAAEGAANNATNKKVIFKNCAPFTNCVSRINNTQVGDANDIDNYLKTSGILWQYCRDDPAIYATNSNIVDFNADNATTDLFKIKEKITSKTGNNDTKRCVMVATTVEDQGATFSITDTKLYVPVVTSPIQDNATLLEQLKSGFKRTINWNKYQSKISTKRQSQYLNYLIDTSFQGVNRLFLLSFED